MGGVVGGGGHQVCLRKADCEQNNTETTPSVEEALVTIAITIALISNLSLGEAHFDITVSFSTKMKGCEE